MNSSHHDSRLTDELQRAATLFDRRGGAEAGLAQVIGRARRIRRRRRTGTAVAAAAAVAAVVVPTTVLDSGTGGPAPAPAPIQQPTPTPSAGATQRIGLGELPTGAAPRIGWLRGERYHAADGSVHDLAPVPGRVRAVAQLGDALVVSADQDSGQLRAFVVTGESTRDLGPMMGGLATSPDGSVAAFVAADGTPEAVQDGGRQVIDLPRIDDPDAADATAVAVSGEDCSASADTGCAVWVASTGPKMQTWRSSSHGGEPSPLPPPISRLVDVDAAGIRAGVTRIDEQEPGSCSRVESASGERLWATCTVRFLEFSPAGDLLLASGPYASGFGDGTLAVLDAASGGHLLDLRTEHDAAITTMTWEDDQHVLATVAVQGRRTRWAIVRIGVDGRMEYAVPPTSSGPEAPFALALP